MKYSVAAIIAAAAGASAHYAGNVTVITEVVDSYTTYCPGPTEITHGSQTYTVTEATTLTITDCPCTITKPVHVSTSAVPPPAGSSAVVVPPPAGPPAGETTPAVIPPPATGGVTPTKGPAPVPTAGAGKAAALSGAGLAGVVGLAAFIL